MAKPKVVVDTNVLVRILRSPAGRMLILTLPDKFMLYTNEYILSECEDVLVKKFGYTKQKSKTAATRYKRLCTLLEPEWDTTRSSGIRDQNDEPIVSLCRDACIEMLITDDKDFVPELLHPTRVVSFDQLKSILQA